MVSLFRRKASGIAAAAACLFIEAEMMMIRTQDLIGLRRRSSEGNLRQRSVEVCPNFSLGIAGPSSLTVQPREGSSSEAKLVVAPLTAKEC